ncbi:MAG: hypothetical protein ABW169_00060 [Sphingobium sp.]
MPEFNGFDPALAAERASEAPSSDSRDPSERSESKRNRWSNGKSKATPLSPDQAKRQGQVSQKAFLTLGQARAIAFLNGHDAELCGRPLDLAIQSQEGLGAVERLLETLKAQS